MRIHRPQFPGTTGGEAGGGAGGSTKPKNPNIVWSGRDKPNPKRFDPKLYTVRPSAARGGYVVIKKKPKAPKPGAPGGPGAPPAPPVPYADLPEWARPSMLQIDADQKHHEGYVSGSVMPWLSQGLQNLTGVNPAAPGYNPVIQQQFLANIAGQVGGTLDSAAAATPAQVASSSPGGGMYAPNAYQGAAMREASRQRGGAAINMAQAEAARNTLQPNIFAQGALRTIADFAKGLPAIYAQKRSEQRTKYEQFVQEQQQAAAELAEEQRSNRVREAISGMNAQTNAAIQFGRLGLSADELAVDTAADQQEVARANADRSLPAPYGYTRDPASGRVYRDPSVPQARPPSTTSPGGAAPGSTSTRDAQGRLLVPSLQEGGWTRYPVGRGKVDRKKFKVTIGADGKRWIKRIGEGSEGGATTKPAAGKPPQDVYEKLVTANDKGLISSDQNQGTPDLLRFLRPLQPGAKGRAWNQWFAQILAVLDRVDPQYGEWIEGWVKRRKVDGSWQGRF